MHNSEKEKLAKKVRMAVCPQKVKSNSRITVQEALENFSNSNYKVSRKGN